MTKKHTKNKSNIKDKQVRKDYSKGNASPYREWVEKYNTDSINSDRCHTELFQANPDGLDESKGIYYQAECVDDRLDLIEEVKKTLTDKQLEILRMCGNEGRTFENCAAILRISKGAVQKTIGRIREKVSVLQKRHITPYRAGTSK